MTALQRFYQKSALASPVSKISLNIAIVTETWPPEINGVAMSVMQLCKGLQQRGHRILLIRPDQQFACHEFQPDEECLVGAQAIPKYPELRFGYPQLWKILSTLKQFRPDIVHIVTEGPLGLAALRAARQCDYPVSSGFHSPFHEFSRFFDMQFLVKPVQHYLCWFHNRTDLTCVPSLETRQALTEFGVTCPMALVARGVDTERFNVVKRSQALRQQWQANEHTTVLMYVGRLSPEKNIDLVIKAYRAAQKAQPNRLFRLVIVGDGPERTRLERIGQDIIFTSMQTGERLAQHYASANAFVFASEVETFGNVVLEALASGLPVIAYHYACAALVVKTNKNGWTCPPGQANEFIQLVCNLPEMARLQRMKQPARQSVQNFGWTMAIDQFEAALSQTVEQRERLYSSAWNKAMLPLFMT